jgi:sulfur carrier protein
VLAELLAQQGIGPERAGIAVARNGEVVRRADWASTTVSAGDRIEVVTARQGG